MLKCVHRAKYVLAESNLLLSNAAVHISVQGRISAVEPWHASSATAEVEVIDWGSAVIIPGLINAHSHLELTSLRGRLIRFRSFTDWLSQLIGLRRLWTREDFLDSAREGAKAALCSGTTLAGDISSSGLGWNAARGEDLRRVVFEEVIGLSPGNSDSAFSELGSLLESAQPDSLLMHGISPHAPYSVSPELYRRLAELSRRRRLPLATHVAETRPELEFLQGGTGEFKSFLSEFNVLPEDWEPPRLAPIAYLDSLGVLGPSCVLIHCNYLDQESINRIARTRSSVVYCPRSHSFFGHDKHPVRQLLDAGINVALGTDSLASNSSLSMLDEMRYLFEMRQDLKSQEIFRAATLNGATALNPGGNLGRVQPGYCADMAVLRLPENLGPASLLTQVMEGAGEPIATIVQGNTAWHKSSDAECERQNNSPA